MATSSVSRGKHEIELIGDLYATPDHGVDEGGIRTFQDVQDCRITRALRPDGRCEQKERSTRRGTSLHTSQIRRPGRAVKSLCADQGIARPGFEQRVPGEEA
jgi:hypothetical protein